MRGAAMWERAYQRARAARAPSPTPNAQACRRRRERLRAAGLCYFCGRNPAPALCGECLAGQRARVADRYRQRAEAEGRAVRPYRRRKGARP